MILATVATAARAAALAARVEALGPQPGEPPREVVVVDLSARPDLADLAARTPPDELGDVLGPAVAAALGRDDQVVVVPADLLDDALASGADAVAGWSTTALELHDGVRYDRVLHSLFVDPPADAPAPPHPFREPEAFVAWCATPGIGGYAPVPRAFLRARELRHDLLVGYPEVPGRDAAELREWIRVYGLAEYGLPRSFLPDAPADEPSAYDQAGANVVGLFDAELGMGEVARRIADALAVAHVPTARVTYRTREHAVTRAAASERARFDTNIVCLNPDSLPTFTQQTGLAFRHGRTTIGVWFWETARFPSMFHGSFASVDEIWVASDFVASALRAAAPPQVPVVQFPLPIVVPAVDPTATRATFGLPDDRVLFHTSFDHRSVANRKNPFGVVEAFVRAFGEEDGAHLVVKSTNADADPAASARLRALAADRRDITFLDALLAPAANAALLALADCHVSLHRSEGFGFNIADALALGVPVVATGATGNLAFCRPEHVALVPATEIPVGEGSFPYEPDATWFDPDLDAAVAAMAAVAADPAGARARAAAGRSYVLDEFSPARCGAFARDRLAMHRAVRAERAAADAAAAEAARRLEPPPPSLLARLARHARERIHG